MNFGPTRAAKRQSDCRHNWRQSSDASGVQRQICGNCGQVSFAFSETGLSQVDRARFARSVDELAASGA